MTTQPRNRDGNADKRAGSSRRRGITATEFALVLPLLMIMAFGCVDLGRAVEKYMVVSNAARVGAEYGATHRFTPYTKSVWTARIREAVEEDLSDPYDTVPDPGGFTIKIKTQDVDNSTDTDLVLVRVQVESHFEPTFQWPGLPTTIHVKHHVHMRQFR